MSENPQKYLNAKEAKAPIDTTSIKVDEDEVAEEGVSAKGEETKGEEDVLEEDGAAVKAKVRAQVKKEIDEMNADSEDETYEFQEDELEALLDEVEKETFTTEEEAIAFLEEKHKAYVKRVSTDTESFEVIEIVHFSVQTRRYNK